MNHVEYDQSGFRASFSTDWWLALLVDLVLSEVDKGMYTGMILMDFQKYFVTLDNKSSSRKDDMSWLLNINNKNFWVLSFK